MALSYCNVCSTGVATQLKCMCSQLVCFNGRALLSFVASLDCNICLLQHVLALALKSYMALSRCLHTTHRSAQAQAWASKVYTASLSTRTKWQHVCTACPRSCHPAILEAAGGGQHGPMQCTPGKLCSLLLGQHACLGDGMCSYGTLLVRVQGWGTLKSLPLARYWWPRAVTRCPARSAACCTRR